MKTRKGFRHLICALLLLAWGAPSHAARNSQFGIMYGFSVPDADNTNPFHLFGVKGEAFMTPIFSFGGYYLLSDRSGQKDSTEQFAYSLHGVEAAYHIAADSGDTFIAVRTGVTKVRQSPGGVDMTFSPYHYGIATGYDYYITEKVALGFEGSYLHVLPGRTTLGATDYLQKSFNIISFLVSIQVRL